MIDVEYGLLVIPELIVSKCIKHTHIVSASKVIRENNKLHIIYNSNGLSLKTLIEKDELSIVQKLKIIFEIGTAIATLHSKGYCHGAITIDNIVGEYDELYYCPKLITKASLGSPEKYSSDFEDYKMFILGLLCPHIEESYRLCKNDLSIILPYIPKSLRDFVVRVCSHTKIFEILSSPEFDKFNKTGIITRFHWTDDIQRIDIENKITNVDIKSNYREGVKMIYNIFRDYLSDHYVDEMFASIDIYNRGYFLIKDVSDLPAYFSAYYCACILIGCKIFNSQTITIDDIRDAIHTLLKSHPKRENVLSWELDIIVGLNGNIYAPGLFEECKTSKELYSLLIFYILDNERFTGYHLLLNRLKKMHNIHNHIHENTNITCAQLFQLEHIIPENEMEQLENFLE